MTDSPTQTAATLDRVLSFSIPARDVRGRVVRLGPTLDTILGVHDYPPALAHCLAEALVLTALMGSMLKGEGDQLTMQAQGGDGLVRLLVCDYRDGALRGYVERSEHQPEAGMGANCTLAQLFGGGHLAITFDIAAGKRRYQGIVPLEGASLAEAVENYFLQSEQIPTLARTAIVSDGKRIRAGGLLVQHIPEGEDGRERLHVRFDHPEWEHVAILAGSLRHEELVDQELPLDDIVWRLFHEESEVRVTPGPLLTRGCRCSQDYYASVLARFPSEERLEMANDAGVIVVDCAFCSREFAINP